MIRCMAINDLVNIQGTLYDVVTQVKLGSALHADEVTLQRISDTDLRGDWFWAADFSMYTVEGGEVVLYMARGKDNLLFRNIAEGTKQIRQTGNYVITDLQDIASVVNSATTLRIALDDLGLQKYDDEFSYFEIDTENPVLNAVQRVFAERVYGRGTAFDDVMRALRTSEQKINFTRIYVLNPDYVKKHVNDDNGAIARASVLDDLFVSDSDFNAANRDVDYDGRLRGVRRESVAEVAPQMDFNHAYDTLITNPEKLTPKQAEGLANLVAKYFGRNKSS